MQIGNRDLDKLDPDWRFAYFHAKSTKPGICSEPNPELCDCCLNIIHKQSIHLGVHAKQLEFLGFGFPLWYSFLKYCIILTLILIVSEGCVSVYRAINMNKELCIEQYNTYFQRDSTSPTIIHQSSFLIRRGFSHSSEKETQHSNPAHVEGGHSEPQNEDSLIESHGEGEGQEKGHHGPKCTGVFILLSRIDTKIDDLQNVLRISTFCIVMLTLLFIRDNIYKTEQYYDERRCSLGDYSVMISQLPAVDGIQASIRRFFAEGLSEPYKIEQMILIPELQNLQHVQHEKSHLIKELQKLSKDKEQNQKQIMQIEHQIEQLQKKQNLQVQSFKNELDSDKIHSQSVIVVLSSEPQKQRFLKEFEQYDKEQMINYFGDQGQKVEIEQAPQPRQIIWENINYPGSKRFGRILTGWLLSILFIAVITLIFYFILKWKTHMVEQKESVREATIIVFIALILVILFNKFVMGHVLHHFTHIQKHATSDKEQFSFAFKYALGMFFTTALMTLFVEALTYNNFYQHHYGVIEQQSIMFFMNSLLVPIIWAINPFQIYVLIKRKINFGKKHLTQREANHIMEDFNYDVGKRYAEILQSMWFTFLYISLIPMGAFLTAIGIGLYYWVDKYNLLRRSSIHQNVSGKLSIIALKLLDLVLVFMPLGQIIFDHFLRHDIKWTSIIMLVVAIIYLCLPLNDIIDIVNKENFYLEEKSYRSVKHEFKDNYYTLHPMYSKINADENSESRRLYKKSVLDQYGNPVFSFAMGWLSNIGKNNMNVTNKSGINGKSIIEKQTATEDKNSFAQTSNVMRF